MGGSIDTSIREWLAANFNAKGAAGTREGTQRRFASATFAQDLTALAARLNNSLTLADAS
jgi:hypothetical protein